MPSKTLQNFVKIELDPDLLSRLFQFQERFDFSKVEINLILQIAIENELEQLESLHKAFPQKDLRKAFSKDFFSPEEKASVGKGAG